jgi:hypothetical protein
MFKKYIIEGKRIFNDAQLNQIADGLNINSDNIERFKNEILTNAGVYLLDCKKRKIVILPSEVEGKCENISCLVENLNDDLDNFRNNSSCYNYLKSSFRKINNDFPSQDNVGLLTKEIMIINALDELLDNHKSVQAELQKVLKDIIPLTQKDKPKIRKTPTNETKRAIYSLAQTFKSYTRMDPSYTQPTDTSNNKSRGPFFDFVVSVLEPTYSFLGKSFPKDNIFKHVKEVTKDFKNKQDDPVLYY